MYVEEGGRNLATVTEATTGHYEVQEVEFGRVYRWCPGYVVVECDCGEVSTLTESVPVCRWCGADYAGAVRDGLALERSGDEALHPWRYTGDREETGLPF